MARDGEPAGPSQRLCRKLGLFCPGTVVWGLTELQQLIAASVQVSVAAHPGGLLHFLPGVLRTSLIVSSCLNTEQLSFGRPEGFSRALGLGLTPFQEGSPSRRHTWAAVTAQVTWKRWKACDLGNNNHIAQAPLARAPDPCCRGAPRDQLASALPGKRTHHGLLNLEPSP